MVNGVLMIHSVNQSDAGMYQCVAENKHGAIYTSAELQVLGMYLTTFSGCVSEFIMAIEDKLSENYSEQISFRAVLG